MAGDMNTKTPLTISSSENKLGIRFKSSTLFNFRGMKIQYLVKPADGKTDEIAPSPYDSELNITVRLLKLFHNIYYLCI